MMGKDFYGTQTGHTETRNVMRRFGDDLPASSLELELMKNQVVFSSTGYM